MKTKKKNQKQTTGSEQEIRRPKRSKPMKNSKRKLSIYDDFDTIDTEYDEKYDEFQ